MSVVVDDIEVAAEFYRTVLGFEHAANADIGIYSELFTYHQPKGDQAIHRRQTNDLGGVHHVALEVSDAVAAYWFMRSLPLRSGRSLAPRRRIFFGLTSVCAARARAG